MKNFHHIQYDLNILIKLFYSSEVEGYVCVCVLQLYAWLIMVYLAYDHFCNILNEFDAATVSAIYFQIWGNLMADFLTFFTIFFVLLFSKPDFMVALTKMSLGCICELMDCMDFSYINSCK